MFYNSHIHTFREPDVPRRFLPLALVPILTTRKGFRFVGRILSAIIPFTDKDMFDRYLRFVEIARFKTQQDIFEECRRFYPAKSKFIILPMDMAFMNAGKVPRKYEEQLDELAILRDKFPEQVILFIHIDPRRPGVLGLLKKYVEEKKFKGVKLYPPLGVYPDHPVLMNEVFPYCEEKNLPVLAHGSPYNPVKYRGNRRQIIQLLGKRPDDPDVKGVNKRELLTCFTHPENYTKILEKFKKLKICIAHFGSEYYWKEYIENPGNKNNWFIIIRRMLEDYENFYTDISFTLNHQEFFPLLKVLLADEKIKHKILFGSDYYMVETKTDERRFGLELRAFIGEENFKTIAVDNPERYLG
ncbi:MAG: amidohydrolase [Bacteroidales bacterium]|nr:amidohydrolase [Bacteroidales bacterium]